MNQSDSARALPSPLIAILLRAGVPPLRAELVLAALAQRIYHALWVTQKLPQRRAQDFDPLTAMLEQIDLQALARELELSEAVLATGLTDILPLLMGQRRLPRSRSGLSDRELEHERLAVRVLIRLLRQKFRPAPRLGKPLRQNPRDGGSQWVLHQPELRPSRAARRLRTVPVGG